MTGLKAKARVKILPLVLIAALGLSPDLLAAQSGPPGGMPPGGMPPPGMRPGRPPKPPKPVKVETLLDVVADQHRAADADGDGFLTLAEVRGQIAGVAALAVRRRFETIDLDRSGTIDLAEFSQWQGSMGSRVLSDVAAASVTTGMVPETLPFDPSSGEQAMILRVLIEPVGATVVVNADSNLDGRVDVAELQRYQRIRFDELDANRDGALDFTEMPRPARGPGEGLPDGMPPIPPGAMPPGTGRPQG